MSEQVAIGVDIGGTKVAFVAITAAGEVVARHRIDTPLGSTVDYFMDILASELTAFMQDLNQPVAGIGLGCPGYVDTQAGVVMLAAIMKWYDFPVRAELERRLAKQIPIYVGNDVNALALGEMYYGAGKSERDYTYVALGTGLGTAAIVDGHLLDGAHHSAMEMGHIMVDPQGRLCHCGRRGCLEMYVSGIGLNRAMKDYAHQFPDSPLVTHEATNQALIQAMQAGTDPLALHILEEASYWMHRLLGWCDAILNPSLYILGGGMGLALAPLILEDLRAFLISNPLYSPENAARIVLAQVDDTAVGAASLVWHGIQEQVY